MIQPISLYAVTDALLFYLFQKIFDNIMNHDIPWPKVPEEMSYETYDLINK